METMNLDYLDAAANAVYRQLMNDPLLGLPVDPDVADCMGAFADDAMSEEDVLESYAGVDENLVAVGEDGEG